MNLSAEDVLAIERVLLAYCTGIDTRNWTLFRECFTDHFQAEYGQFGTWSNADQFVAAMRTMHESVGPTLHRLSNVVLQPTQEGVNARSYVDAVLTNLEATGPVHQAQGYYDDELVHTEGCWRIRRRRFTAVRIV